MKNLKRMIPHTIALVTLFGLQTLPAFAGTQAEYQALQQWCIGRDKWSAGGRKTSFSSPKEYFHFHHYCGAMRAMNNIYATSDPAKQRFEAGLVVAETGYVIGHVPEHHFLMPEVYALRGRAQLLVKQTVNAEETFNKALKLDPRHIEVYTGLANLYLNSNRKVKASETIQKGLTIDSQHRGLRRLAVKLGIKMEELEAASKQEQAIPSPNELNQSHHSGASQDLSPILPMTASAPAITEPPQLVVDKEQEKNDVQSNNTETTTTIIGSPTNPWCRFCPDTPATPPVPTPSTPGAVPKAVR